MPAASEKESIVPPEAGSSTSSPSAALRLRLYRRPAERHFTTTAVDVVVGIFICFCVCISLFSALKTSAAEAVGAAVDDAVVSVDGDGDVEETIVGKHHQHPQQQQQEEEEEETPSIISNKNNHISSGEELEQSLGDEEEGHEMGEEGGEGVLHRGDRYRRGLLAGTSNGKKKQPPKSCIIRIQKVCFFV